MPAPDKLASDTIYHIYNRGVDRTTIFREEENYRFFLKNYIKHIEPVAATYAYCLQPNHFHFVVRTYPKPPTPTQPTPQRSKKTSEVVVEPSQAFSNFFNGYVRSFNKLYKRTGGLFEGRFGRKPVYDTAYLMRLITYVHQNPQLHGLVDDFRSWTYSSFGAFVRANARSRIARDVVFGIFGGVESFNELHAQVQTSEVEEDL